MTTTTDKFIGGRIMARQLESGFRSGLDAVMLAASVPGREPDEVLELGSGAGVATLCLARRTGCAVFGVEIDRELAILADENAAENDLSERVRFVTGDVLDMPPDLRRSFEHVMCNPPFHDAEGLTSPDASRARALQDGGSLEAWLTAGMKRVVSGGTFTAVLRADRLNAALTALGDRGVTLFPLWPRAGDAAKRILVRAVKGSNAPLAVLPGLVLHDAGSSFTRAANQILRDGAALDISGKAWRAT
jgi:tRNA1(Val) A37 N6-methylase TrmN6